MRIRSPKVGLLNTSKMSANDHSGKIDKNTFFEANVIDLADSGNAVVEHPSGLRFFVAGAWFGERVKVKVLDLKSRFGLGELVEVIEANPNRVVPPCPHQGSGAKACGGCSWMFINYEAQLQAKFDRVSQAIRRFDDKCIIEAILPSSKTLGYRVRAQLKTNGKKLGFVANGMRELVAIDDCVVLTDTNRSTLAELKSRLPQNAWTPTSRKQDWVTLDIDETCSAENVSVNQRLPFQQANAQQNQVMKTWLQKKVEAFSQQAKVLELFAGSGNFTEVLSQAGFEEIIAVEVVEAAVESLRVRQLAGVKAVTCNLFDEESFKRLLLAHKETEILVLDPPRDGLKMKQGLFSKKSKIREVLYVSCDLATLCRDLREFKENGFALLEVQPLDLMPQTPHVEVLCHLRKKGK